MSGVADGMLVTCAQAAAGLGVSASQVRRWIQGGAPVARERRPMLLDLDDIRKWRRRQPTDSLELFAIGMLKTLRTEFSDGKTAPRLLGIDEKRAAALLLAAFDKGHFEVTGHGSDNATNQAIAQLRRIATA